jgi:hypothetical protein
VRCGSKQRLEVQILQMGEMCACRPRGRFCGGPVVQIYACIEIVLTSGGSTRKQRLAEGASD